MVRSAALTAFLLLVSFSPAGAEDCTTAVTTAFEKLRTEKSFRMETQIANAQGKLNLKVDYMPPDRMHQRVRLDDQPQEMEMIVIGEKAWSNQGQGWVELPGNFASEVAKQVKTTMAGATQTEAKYSCGADEVIDGRPAKAYIAELKAPVEEKSRQEKESKEDSTPPPANRQTLYVDAQSGLPVRNVVVDGKDASKTLFDGRFKAVAGIDVQPPKVSP